MPSKLKKPTNWKRIALLTAAAGALAGVVTLRGKPVEKPENLAQPQVLTPAVETSNSKAKTTKPLTWEEAIKRIEQDARQRVKKPSLPVAQKDKPGYGSEQDILDKFAQHEALYSLRSYDGAGYIRRTLPALHPQIYDEINADFERLLLHYIRGGMPSEFEGIDKLRTRYAYEGEYKKMSFEEQIKEAQTKAAKETDYEKRRQLFEAEMGFALGEFKSHYFNHELPKRGYSLVPSGSHTGVTELYSKGKLISRATEKEVESHWKNRRR